MTAASHDNEIGGTAFLDSATGQTNEPTGNKGTVPAVFVVPPLGNLISGNGQNGVRIDTGSRKNVLNGNFIGTTANGNAAIANIADGVLVTHADNNASIGRQFVDNPFVYYDVVAGNGETGYISRFRTTSSFKPISSASERITRRSSRTVATAFSSTDLRRTRKSVALSRSVTYLRVTL